METYNRKHNSQIRTWLMARGMDPALVSELPANGVVVQDVCAGFIRMVEGGSGMVDSYITNPNATPEARDEALNLLTIRLIELGKELGLKRLIAITKDENTRERATSHGYVVLPHAAIARDLGE